MPVVCEQHPVTKKFTQCISYKTKEHLKHPWKERAVDKDNLYENINSEFHAYKENVNLEFHVYTEQAANKWRLCWRVMLSDRYNGAKEESLITLVYLTFKAFMGDLERH